MLPHHGSYLHHGLSSLVLKGMANGNPCHYHPRFRCRLIFAPRQVPLHYCPLSEFRTQKSNFCCCFAARAKRVGSCSYSVFSTFGCTIANRFLQSTAWLTGTAALAVSLFVGDVRH
jgi:hypothetical protein